MGFIRSIVRASGLKYTQQSPLVDMVLAICLVVTCIPSQFMPVPALVSLKSVGVGGNYGYQKTGAAAGGVDVQDPRIARKKLYPLRRLERREVLTSEDGAWLDGNEKWNDLKSIIRYRCWRTEEGRTTVTDHYYSSNLTVSAQEFGGILRGHWSIENQFALGVGHEFWGG